MQDWSSSPGSVAHLSLTGLRPWTSLNLSFRLCKRLNQLIQKAPASKCGSFAWFRNVLHGPDLAVAAQALDPASSQLQNLGQQEGGSQGQCLPDRALADKRVPRVPNQLSPWPLLGFYQVGAHVSSRKGKKIVNFVPTLCLTLTGGI